MAKPGSSKPTRLDRPASRRDRDRNQASQKRGRAPGAHRRPEPFTTRDDRRLERLTRVATWLRSFHTAVATFEPPPNAVWREGGRWEPGLIIGHNDAAPYNAAWADGKFVGFFDWDLAAPVTQEWDLAFTALAWVPLHARRVVNGEGFTAFADRPRRLCLFLDTYAWDGPIAEFVSTIQARVTASAEGIQRTAATGDPAYQRMLDTGVDASLRAAVRELEDFRSEVDT
jgi:aminoglycoside phosphotransferase (APT) family kinase protein